MTPADAQGVLRSRGLCGKMVSETHACILDADHAGPCPTVIDYAGLRKALSGPPLVAPADPFEDFARERMEASFSPGPPVEFDERPARVTNDERRREFQAILDGWLAGKATEAIALILDRIGVLEANAAPRVDLARPPIDRYVFATVDIPGGQIFAGLAYEEGEALAPMCAALADYATYAADIMRKKGDKLDEDVAHALTEATRINVEECWPGRAWFVEVWNEREALTQTYAPYGRPRVR